MPTIPNLPTGISTHQYSNPSSPQNLVGAIFKASAMTTKALLTQSGLDAKQITVKCRLIHRNISPNLATGNQNIAIDINNPQENRVLKRTVTLVKCFKQTTESAKSTNPEGQIDFIKKINSFLIIINKKFPKKTANELLAILLAGIKIQCTNNNWMLLPGEYGNTLAHLFASHGNISGLTFLEKHGVSTQQANSYAQKPIHFALQHQDCSVLKHLLKSYADDTEDTGLPNLLDLSIKLHQKSSTLELVKHNFIPSPRSINNTTNFFGIMFSGYAEKIGRSGGGNHRFWAQKIGTTNTEFFKKEYRIYSALKKARYIKKTFDEFIIEQKLCFLNNQKENLHSDNVKKFAKDIFGRTPLHYAALNPNPTVYASLRTKLQTHPHLWKILQVAVDNVGYTAENYFLAIHPPQNQTNHDPD